MTACLICRRAAIPGLTFHSSPICAICAPNALAGSLMIDTTEAESEALEAAGAKAGAYLDSIGKTDLADLNQEQWATFLAHILDGFSKHMREAAANHPPF